MFITPTKRIFYFKVNKNVDINKLHKWVNNLVSYNVSIKTIKSIVNKGCTVMICKLNQNTCVLSLCTNKDYSYELTDILTEEYRRVITLETIAESILREISFYKKGKKDNIIKHIYKCLKSGVSPNYIILDTYNLVLKLLAERNKEKLMKNTYYICFYIYFVEAIFSIYNHFNKGNETLYLTINRTTDFFISHNSLLPICLHSRSYFSKEYTPKEKIELLIKLKKEVCEIPDEDSKKLISYLIGNYYV